MQSPTTLDVPARNTITRQEPTPDASGNGSSPTPGAPPSEAVGRVQKSAAEPHGPTGEGLLGQAKMWVEPWSDVYLQTYGHHPRSPYVEYFWLGVLGPSSTWLARRLALRLEEAPEGFELDTREITRELGLGSRQALQAAFDRAFDRCCRFGLMQRGHRNTLFVRTRLPDLTPRMAERLPDSLRATHDLWRRREAHEQNGTGDGSAILTRARHLAMALLACGDDPERVEGQLHSWQFHPAVAFEAARWATEQHARAQAAVDDAANSNGNGVASDDGVAARD